MQATPLSRYQITLILAYLHQVQPRFLPGRLLASKHLEQLRQRLYLQDPTPLQSIRQDPLLLTVLAALLHNNLIGVSQKNWSSTVSLRPWIENQRLSVSALVSEFDLTALQTALEPFNLKSSASIVELEYLKQQLNRVHADSGERARFMLADQDRWQLVNIQS